MKTKDISICESRNTDLVMMIYYNDYIFTAEGEWSNNFKMMSNDGAVRWCFLIFTPRVLILGSKLTMHQKWLFLPLLLSQKIQSMNMLQEHSKFPNTNSLLPSGNLRVWWWNIYYWTEVFVNAKTRETVIIFHLKRIILLN